MLFSSLAFIFYFLPITLALNYLLSFNRTAQNIWLLIASLFFYAWGEPFFVLILMLSVLVNWFLGLIVDHVREHKGRAKLIIWIACLYNLGFLFFYKYLGFVCRNINSVLNALIGRELLNFPVIALPLGISFFTFQALSYVIDVYRNDAKVQKNPFFVGLYLAFFPQLVAGPIVRYADIHEALLNRKVDFSMFSDGICQFIAGMGRKVLIANSMGIVADHIFNLSALGHNSYNVPASLAWLGLAAYTFQIFFDFSGYSEMALGMGKMFGFRFLVNFNYPYISKSIAEFWRRWHISLSTWFREYVYFPLGGSRVANNDLMVRNTFIVWLITGAWQGAEWTFVLWGLWNFLFIMLERLVKWEERRIPNWLRHIYLMLIVMIGWLFFRTTDFYQAAQYLLNMLGMNSNGFYSDTAWMFVREYWIFFVLAIICSTPVVQKFGGLLKNNLIGFMGKVYCFFLPAAYLLLFLVCVTYLAKGHYNPFIYFNF